MLRHARMLGLLLGLCVWLSPAGSAARAEVSPEALRQSVQTLQRQWNTPGLAVAIVHHDRVVLAEGFGLRDLAAQLPVTPATRFAIGSSTKAFTASALSMLVDEGQLRWDTPLQHYLPAFRLQDPLASQAITALDLLTHRSGLPRHDLAWYGSGRSRQALLDSLEALTPSAAFRSQFQYQNLMYLSAGQLLESVSGQTWEEFVQERLLSPLGMTRSHSKLAAVLADPDHATPYRFAGGKPQALPHRSLEAVGPAGSLYASASDMAQWLRFQLGDGTWEGQTLLRPETLKLQHSPQIVVESNGRLSEIPMTLYGLGWFISPYRGQVLVQHGGNIDGFSAMVALLPHAEAGVAILSNRDVDGLPLALALTLLDQLSGQSPIDWSARLKPPSPAAANPLQPLPRVGGTQPSHGLESYTGSFGNGGYGALAITRTGQRLHLQLGQQRAELEHWHYDSFRVHQPDGPLHGLLLRFETDTLGEIMAASLPLEPNTAAIVFARQADARLSTPAVLEDYVGDYHLPPVQLKIWREGHKLVAQASGQPKLVLEALRPDWFRVQNLNGYFVRFERVKGRPERIWILQPTGMLSGQRLVAPPPTSRPLHP
ncbi:MAG: serine hydrolase [Candidatus Sericytochromatia bacterium]